MEAEVQGERTKVFKLNNFGEEEDKVKSKEKWDLLDHLPLPLPPVTPPPVAPAPQIEAPAPQGDEPWSPIRREPTAPNSSNETVGTIGTNERVAERYLKKLKVLMLIPGLRQQSVLLMRVMKRTRK